ncbi:MAG: 4Fe-4S cluster-binding domain-containing protein [Candidatus Heimdallarchaeota archaeon]|nr:4Fe-4S cluster-binding domain-containing protein [Candidatus Heimdallarchaeota archaeon]
MLTYNCNYECDHCFLYCNSESEGTFTLNQIKTLIEEAKKIETIDLIHFEGGEPFLFYPLLAESIKIVKQARYKVGIGSNGYWATSKENAELYLNSIISLEVDQLMISNDIYHYGEDVENFAKIAVESGRRAKLDVGESTIDPPRVTESRKAEYEKAMPIVTGDVMFRGRAADKLVEGLPTKHWKEFKTCPYEDLVNPTRVHIDSYGNVQICQGLIIGNCWETPLSEIIENYNPTDNPICGPLNTGGPSKLIESLNLEIKEEYVDECHACYEVRKKLMDEYPEILGPKLVYGK